MASPSDIKRKWDSDTTVAKDAQWLGWPAYVEDVDPTLIPLKGKSERPTSPMPMRSPIISTDAKRG